LARIIGLDLGEKRIGIAVSDETETISSSLKVIDANKKPIRAIKALIDEYNAEAVVVGMPLNMDGTKGPQAEKSADFASRLGKELGIKVSTFDERLTTKQGEAILLEADLSRKKRKHTIDKVAAQIMLQTYLDMNKEREA